jgi:pimeloyl-ACP methyl ester carboxylesterase
MKDTNITIVLLPGLNGTRDLFKPLVDKAPSHFNILTVAFPAQESYSYQQLTEYVLEKISHFEGGFILLGESFSGPLALFVAQTKPYSLKGVILAATFVTAPNIKIARFLPWAFGFRLAKFVGSLFCKNQPKSVLGLVFNELTKLNPQVLAERIQAIFSVNAEAALKECSVPIMYFLGKNDFVVPRQNLDRVLAIRSDVKVIEFNTDHFLLQSAPAEAWNAICEFSTTISCGVLPLG